MWVSVKAANIAFASASSPRMKGVNVAFFAEPAHTIMAEAAHPRVTTEPPHPRMNEPPHPSNPHVLSTDDESLEPAGGCEFIARSYQLELFEQAKKQNSILVLGTGSGKTFISVLLIKELAEQIRGSLSSGSKRTVFVVNTVPLVYQQALSIETHTGLRVGKYEGSMAVDYWTVDQWLEQLEKNEVLVMVAQIFLDLILHARLPLSLVNLIIMDECHHASGSHPMREIMRQYESLKKSFPQKCPRVLGLTACVIHRKCKKKDVMDTMKKLESAMDCVLVTTTDQEVTKYSASPKEKIICYKSDTFSEYQEIISAQLQGIIEDVKDDPDIEDKYKKVFIKKMRNISHIMETLGDWCVARAIMYEMEYFDDVERIEDVPALRQLMASLRGRLQEILDYCGREEATMSPIENVSNKVKRLYDIFHACNKVVYGLIFVERRNTAKILYDLLSAAANESDNLAFVKPLYAVGSMSRCSTDIHLAQLELCRQKETLNKFRNGDCNFLVSTSVLEEGVDIRKCNIVIRFDKPQNYRAYLQSRGRARAHPSRYLLMVKVAELQEMLETLEVYREIEASFTQLCHNRQLPTRIESSLHFAEDEYIAPYQPYGINGPKITGNSAIALINLYCGNLPQDKFTVLAPEVVYEKSDQGCVAEIKLPINACLKTKVRGDCMENKELAKKSAALNLCKKLHAMGELNHDLRPAEISDDSILEGLVEVVPEMPIKAGEPEPGTRKRRQLYEREVCQAFTYYHGLFKLYSIIIQPTGTQHTSLLVDSTKSDMSVGLICKRSLLHCPFALYYTKWGEVEVRVKFIKEIMNLNPELMRKIEHFHKFIFETLLDINSVLFDFSSRNTGVYIVPLAQASTIDLTLLTQIYMLPHLRVPIVYRSAESFHFEKSSYEDAIIYPLYTTEEPVHMFYVTEILTNLSPQSEFPDSKHVYSSYCHYYLQKYGKSITNMQQPLISAKHLPKELNYLKMPAMSAMSCKSSNKAKHHPPIFVPELCGVLPLKASLWWQIMCIPSIIHRLNSLNLAHQLNVAMNDSKLISKDVEYEKINFNWPEEIITRINNSGEENLCASLMKSKSEYIHPFVIVHALTLCAAHENFDLERLEILGDSFLKFIITEYLFLKETESHEGRLSLRRGKLVCNRTLSSLAKCKSIPNKMQSFYLEPPLNGLLLGFTIKPEVSNKLRSCNLSHDKWPSLPKSSRLENLQEVVKNIGGEREKASRARKRAANCYNPWSEHDLSDKNIADSTEALIGAYLLAAGADTAVNFMHNLGLGVYNNESLLKCQLEVSSSLLSRESWAQSELNKLYKTACLDRLEHTIKYTFKDKSFIVQAVTHSSYTLNKVTDCYQRLEFLGDAVLDYLITGHVYSHFTSYSPGQISDLRSYYVKNETLAKVAAEMKFNRHLLHMAPKLSISIEKYLKLMQDDYEEDTLNTEDDEVDAEDVDVPKVLGDLVESVIGGVYLDSGRDLQKTWGVIRVLLGESLNHCLVDVPVNCVRQLIELVGEVLPTLPKFKKVPRLKNDKNAKYLVKIDGLPDVCGKGKNYRTAKIAAAKLAIRKFQAHMSEWNMLPEYASSASQ